MPHIIDSYESVTCFSMKIEFRSIQMKFMFVFVVLQNYNGYFLTN